MARADVVITSYSIVANEHATYDDQGKDESKSKGKKKKAVDESDDDNESSGLEDVMRRVKSKTQSSTSKKKDALFRVKWWRIVLGTFVQ